MKKKVVALLAVCILLFSAVVPTFALSIDVSKIDIGEVVTAFQQDLKNAATAGSMLKSLTGDLKGSIVPYVENVVLTEKNFDTLIDVVTKLMIKALEEIKDHNKPEPTTEPSSEPSSDPTEPSSSDPTNPSDPTTPSDPTQPTQPTSETTTQSRIDQIKMKIKDLVNFAKKHLYVELDETGKEAQRIADEAEIEYDIIEEGGTYYMRINIEENRKIFNYGVFRDLVDDLVKKQNAEMLKDENGNYDYVMTYEHIAGELAFHMIAWAAVKGIMKVSGSSSERLLKIYESAAVADLNANESRLPSEVFSILGVILYNFFFFNTLRALGIIKA